MASTAAGQHAGVGAAIVAALMVGLALAGGSVAGVTIVPNKFDEKAFPVRAVATMHRIICQVEADEHYFELNEARRLEPEHNSPGAITAAARQDNGSSGVG